MPECFLSLLCHFTFVLLLCCVCLSLNCPSHLPPTPEMGGGAGGSEGRLQASVPPFHLLRHMLTHSRLAFCTQYNQSPVIKRSGVHWCVSLTDTCLMIDVEHLYSFLFYFMCIDVLLARVSAHHAHVWCLRGQKRVLDPPRLELEMVFRHRVGAGN